MSLMEHANDEINLAIIKSNKLPLIINITKYKQFNIFPKMTLFFLPKKSTIILAGICINMPHNAFIEDNSTTLAALMFFTCVKNRKSIV